MNQVHTMPRNVSNTSPSNSSRLDVGSAVPETDDAFDLGTSDLRWRDVYLSGDVVGSGFADPLDTTKKVQFDLQDSEIGAIAAIVISADQSKYIYVPDVPELDVTLVDTATSQTLTNKTLTSPAISTISNTGVLTLPTSTDTLVGRVTHDTLTNKTLISPVIGTISNAGTLTLPTSTDTLVGRATSDTLTNKTLTSPAINGGTVAGVTGISFVDSGATALSYYNTSAWFPTISFGGASVGVTYASNVGRYVRIGNLVYVDMYMQLSNKGSSTGNASVTLPFISNNNSQSVSANLIASNISLPGTTTMLTAQFAKNSASFGFFGWLPGGAEITILTNSHFANNSAFNFSGMYWV